VVESICLVAAGKIDTHVLMAFAAIGTLYLGMAQEVRLLAYSESQCFHSAIVSTLQDEWGDGIHAQVLGGEVGG
jgi:hypothetical protein